jgi:hypothetical protein
VANLYVVFRLEAVEGEPRADGEESFAAGFYTRAEAEGIAGLSAMSRWAIERAWSVPPAQGLRREPAREGLQRPGHTLFGRW